MTFEITTDEKLIKLIVTHPQIYPHLMDDGAPTADKWEVPAVLTWVLVTEGDHLGVFCLHAENAATVKIHTCLLPEAWGSKAKSAALGIQQWIWENTSFVRLNTDVPEFNRLALRFARSAGLKQFGLNPKSYLKGGKLWDQFMLGISKPGV